MRDDREAKASTSSDEPDSFQLTSREPDVWRRAIVPRVFVREPGWQVHIKDGSEKLFCYAIAPGETNYHRISDGEIYLRRGDERVCLPCAERHGLLHYAPKGLKTASRGVNLAHDDDEVGYPLAN